MCRRHLITRRDAVKFSLAAWLVSAELAQSHAQTNALTLQGSTTFNTAILLEHQSEVETLSGQSLTVLANKSSLGLQALLDHRADLAMLSTALKNEVDLLKQGGATQPMDSLQTHNVTTSRAVLIVHPSISVKSISFDQLRDVLNGKLTNWRDLGGPDLPIRVVATRQGGGVVTTVEARVLGSGNHIAAPNQIRVQNGPQITMIVTQEQGAVGITMEQLARGRPVAELVTPDHLTLELNLISLGDPTPAMSRVITSCREVAVRIGL